MGNQLKTNHQSKGGIQSSIKDPNWNKLWDEIKNTNFDSNEYKFILQIKEVYTDTYGAFLSQEQIQALILEFKRFLFLVAVQCKQSQPQIAEDGNTAIHKLKNITPSPIVDRLWRNLITNTKEYESFCMKQFNGIIERDSNDFLDYQSYEKTRQNIQEQFLAFDQKIWPTYQYAQEYRNEIDGYIWIVLHKFIKFHQAFKNKIESGEAVNFENELQYFRKDQLRLHPEQVDIDSRQHGKSLQSLQSFGFVHKSQAPMMEVAVDAPNDAILNENKDAGEEEKQDQNNEAASVEKQQQDSKVKDGSLEEQVGELPKDGFLQNLLSQGGDLTQSKVLAKKHTAFGYKPAETKIGQHDDFNASDDSIQPELESDDDEEAVPKIEKQEAQNNEENKEAPQTNVEEGNNNKEVQIKVQPNENNQAEQANKDPASSLKDDGQWLIPQWKTALSEIEKIQGCFLPNIVLDNFQREINTTDRLTNQVFVQYKKFHILKQLVDERRRVIPSHSIKQAWDYHIIETAEYRSFCYCSFNKFVHNEILPGKFGKTQYHDYGKTLEIYEIVFQTKPPAHIWPEPEGRFNYTAIFSRKFINMNSYMVAAQENKNNPDLEDDSHLNPNAEIMMRQRKASMAKMKDLKSPNQDAQFVQVSVKASRASKKGSSVKFSSNIQEYKEEKFMQYYKAEENKKKEANGRVKKGGCGCIPRGKSGGGRMPKPPKQKPRLILEQKQPTNVPKQDMSQRAADNVNMNGNVEGDIKADTQAVLEQVKVQEPEAQNLGDQVNMSDVKIVEGEVKPPSEAAIEQPPQAPDSQVVGNGQQPAEANIGDDIANAINGGQGEHNVEQQQLNADVDAEQQRLAQMAEDEQQKIEAEVEKQKDNIVAQVGENEVAIDGNIDGDAIKDAGEAQVAA